MENIIDNDDLSAPNFNEASLEEYYMKEFEEKGYIHIDGDTIERNYREIILKNDIKEYLLHKYPDLSETEMGLIIDSFPVLDRGDYTNNRETFLKIVNGFSFKRADKKKQIWINLIDFENTENNIFKIVNQYKIQGPKEERVPDALVFINGIPLIVMEFKSAVREEATIYTAFEQINTRYIRDIPDLFAYNAFTLISDGVNTKIGTQFTKYENYYSWNKASQTDKPSEGLDNIDTVIDGVFEKERLLSIIDNFIYFPDSSGKNLKVICRYPQYFGATALYDNIERHMLPKGDGKGGTYFGTTGCGKSYTMLFLSRLLMRSKSMANPTIVLITDRNNLDHQLTELFTASKNFLFDNRIQSIDSRDDLKLKLKGLATGGIFLTTIQKFSEADNVLSERNNIIVISDEAHRSQLNLEEGDVFVKGKRKHIVGFAKILHDSLPNATYVGFTGTPIDNTLEVFGDIIDQYTMVESEKDKITSKLVYEGRASIVTLNSKQMEEIEEYYTKCEEGGSNLYQIEQSKKDLSKMEIVIGNDKRIANIAKDFVAHYEKRVEESATVAGKVLFACISRQVAYKLYLELKKLRPDWFVVKEADNSEKESDDKVRPIEMVKLVATRGKDDPKEMYDLLGDNKYKKDLDAQFKKIYSNFKIAIVVDMWLTGFDVPFLDTIYIDKPIQKHSLIQAISRVNRIYEKKEYGLIVDYLGIEKELNAALKKYTNGFKSEGFDTAQDFVVALKQYLNILDGLFFEFDRSDYYSNDAKKQLSCLKNAMEYIQKDNDTEKRFMTAVRKMKVAYNNCIYSDDIGRVERNSIYFYSAVRSLLVKLIRPNVPDTAMMNVRVRELVERAIESDEVIQLFSQIEDVETKRLNILSDEYLERIKKIPGLNTKFKLLQRLAKVTISTFKRTNKLKADDFSDRFRRIVAKYNDRHFRVDDIVNIVNELSELLINIRREQESAGQLGMDIQEKAFYDILLKIIDDYKFEFDNGLLPEMAKRMRECTDKACSVLDWYNREDTKAELRMDIVLILEKFGFPPVYYDGVYKQVFQQMENYKRCSD